MTLCSGRMVSEAPLEETEVGSVATGEGWFVLNARDVPWWRHTELGQDTDFEGNQEFPHFGFRIHVLLPGQPNGMAADHCRSLAQARVLSPTTELRLPPTAL